MALRNPVLLVLCLLIVAAAISLPFLGIAPNRLVSGRPVPLSALLHDWRIALLLPAIALATGPFLPQSKPLLRIVLASAVSFAAGLLWLAGAEATATAASSPAARTSLGSAFWVMWCGAMLAALEAAQRLRLPPAASMAVGAVAIGAVLLQIAAGHLDDLSLVREYANQRDTFLSAVARHGVLVFGSMLPTLLIGVPLGLRAYRSRRVANVIFPVLNIVQTIPSIALFALLLAPLSALSASFPWLAGLGVSGIGLAPAIIALILYSLLPIARNTAAGLATVPTSVRESAQGMGMTPRQILWRVEVPLAMPVFLSGLRITLVQAIGLAAVSALIGAGGLGAIMFQGLFANALDLVLLGALPVILFALVVDSGLKLVTAAAVGPAR